MGFACFLLKSTTQQCWRIKPVQHILALRIRFWSVNPEMCPQVLFRCRAASIVGDCMRLSTWGGMRDVIVCLLRACSQALCHSSTVLQVSSKPLWLEGDNLCSICVQRSRCRPCLSTLIVLYIKRLTTVLDHWGSNPKKLTYSHKLVPRVSKSRKREGQGVRERARRASEAVALSPLHPTLHVSRWSLPFPAPCSPSGPPSELFRSFRQILVVGTGFAAGFVTFVLCL